MTHKSAESHFHENLKLQETTTLNMDAFLVNGGIRSNTLSPEESARYFTGGILNAFSSTTLQWRHNGRDGVSNHQPHDCLLNRLFKRRSKKTSKLRVTGLCAGNSPVTGEFPAQRASNVENVSIWWRHHEKRCNFD